MKASPAWIIIALTAMISHAHAETRTIRVFVALADNASQGIAPVPAKIGNGDEAATNLYWGASEGFKSVFGRSKSWKLEKTEADPSTEILERRTYKHSSQDCRLVGEAWRGKNIRECLEAFLAALHSTEYRLVAFIGHNGLMDVSIPVSTLKAVPQPPDAIILCCISGRYFQPHLDAAKACPVLTTTQLMYPGSFLLRDTLEVWLRRGSRPEIRPSRGKGLCRGPEHLHQGGERRVHEAGVMAPQACTSESSKLVSSKRV